MKTASTALFLALTIFATPGLAETKTLSSAPLDIYSNFGGAEVTCNFYNAGSDPVTFTSRGILDGDGGSETLSSDTCGSAPLQPKHSCLFNHATDVGGTFVCRARAKGATVRLRGIAAFRPSASSVLMTAPIE